MSRPVRDCLPRHRSRQKILVLAMHLIGHMDYHLLHVPERVQRRDIGISDFGQPLELADLDPSNCKHVFETFLCW